MDETELQAIRAARLAELQNGGVSQAETRSKNNDVTISLLSQFLEPSARERLSRVKMVRPERAQAVEQYLLGLFNSGNISRKLNENDIVEILDRLSKDDKQQGMTQIVFERRDILDDDSEIDRDDFFD